jgi:hypothetical protein
MAKSKDIGNLYKIYLQLSTFFVVYTIEYIFELISVKIVMYV